QPLVQKTCQQDGPRYLRATLIQAGTRVGVPRWRVDDFGLASVRHGSEAMRDPLRRQLLLHGILSEARGQPAKVDAIDRLVLVEAREDVAHLAGRRVTMRLQALRADLLHHALHRRID